MTPVFLDTVGLIALWDESDMWHAPATNAQAWEVYDGGQPGDAGIVDLISFAVIRRLSITEAFTNDRHFKAAGFATLF